MNKVVCDDDLIKIYSIAANIVNLHGEKYLPIFERLHSEMELRKAKRQLLNLAKNVELNSE